MQFSWRVTLLLTWQCWSHLRKREWIRRGLQNGAGSIHSPAFGTALVSLQTIHGLFVSFALGHFWSRSFPLAGLANSKRRQTSNIWPIVVVFLQSVLLFLVSNHGGAVHYLMVGFANYMGLGLLILSILCFIARCCWRPLRYKCVDHVLNVVAAIFLYFVLLFCVLVWQNPVVQSLNQY